MVLSHQLKQYRQAYGYTQEKLAESCGVSRQAVAKWENGTSFPDVENLIRLSELFHTSLDTLITGKDAIPQTDPHLMNDFQSEDEKLINKALQQAMKCDDPNEELQMFLASIGHMVSCDRVYIFERDPQGDYCNTYEWCNRGVSPQIHTLQSVPESEISSWVEALNRGEAVYLENLEELKNTDARLYRKLSAQDIHALLILPLSGGKGFFGVDNPPAAFVSQTAVLMELVVHFVECMLQRRDLIQNLLIETDQNRELDRVAHRVPYYLNLKSGSIVIDLEPLRDLGYHFTLHTLDDLYRLLEDHPECRYHVLQEGIEKVARTRQTSIIEFVFYSHNHTIHWVRLSIRPFLDSQGNLLQLTGSLRDISDEHKIVERYNMFTTHMRGGMHICYLSDPCHLSYASDNLCSLLGYTREEFDAEIGDRYDSLLVDEDYAAFKGFVRRLTENPGTAETCEYGLKRRDGSVVRVIDTMESVLDGNGIVYGYANVMDVSEMHRILAISKENELKELAALDKQYEIVAALSRDYRNVFLVDLEQGQAMIHLLNGYAPGGLTPKTGDPIPYSDYCRWYIQERVYPEDQEMLHASMQPANLREKLKVQDEYCVAYRILEDGRIRYCQCKYLLLDRKEVERGEPGSVIMAFQVMESSLQQSIARMGEIQRQRDQAEQANQAKSMFLARMSHDIRTPINTMLGMNELIMKESDSAEIRGYAADIASSGNTLLSLINDILDLTKLDSGIQTLEEQEYDLSALLREASVSLRMQCADKGLHAEANFDEQLPVSLVGDEKKLKEVLINLVSNAVKYTESGTVAFTVSLPEPQPEGRHVLIRFSVKDTGIGIAPQDQERIFDAFERAHEEDHPKILGSGLGLNISKKIVSMMGSELRVASEVGVGSEFWFDVEQRAVSDEVLGKQEFPEAAEGQKTSEYSEKTGAQQDYVNENARILVVDDTCLNLKVIRALLKRTKASVDTVASGAECIALVQKQQYDLIFLDAMMPQLSGAQTLQWIRSQPNLCRDTPVIVLTADAIVGAKEKYLKEGFTDYLSKPVTGKSLEALCAKYLPAQMSEIDQDLGLQNCSDDLAFYRELLNQFAEDSLEKEDRLQKDVAAEDWTDYQIAAHSLKGNARIIGARGLAEHAGKHEEAARTRDFTFIRSDLSALILETESVRKEIAAEEA